MTMVSVESLCARTGLSPDTVANYARIAQKVEEQSLTKKDVGSNPVASTRREQ